MAKIYDLIGGITLYTTEQIHTQIRDAIATKAFKGMSDVENFIVESVSKGLQEAILSGVVVTEEDAADFIVNETAAHTLFTLNEQVQLILFMSVIPRIEVGSHFVVSHDDFVQPQLA